MVSLFGPIFIPKIPSYKILDVAEAIGPRCKKPTVGVRPGEKIHEEMITAADSFNTYDLGKYYTILPSETIWNLQDFINQFQANLVKKGFTYNSGTNTEWESVETLRQKIKEYLKIDLNS